MHVQPALICRSTMRSHDPTIEIIGVTGTSAGAMNGAVLVDGLLRGGPQRARVELRRYWEAVGAMPGFGSLRRFLQASTRCGPKSDESKVAEHHREVAALARGRGSGRHSRWRLGGLSRSRRMRESFGRRLFLVLVTAQRGDGFEQRAAVPDKVDAQILQVLRRQAWQDLLVDRIVAECSIVLSEAEAPQPSLDIQVQSPALLLATVMCH
jgi:hypothetical protein